MLKILRLICCFLLPAAMFAQTRPAAEGRGASLWVGGEISTFNPDWGCETASPFTCWDHQMLGFAPFIDANDLLPVLGIGIEAEARILRWRGPGGFTEASYMAGPRFKLFRFKGAYFTGKVTAGTANLSVPLHEAGDGNHFAFAPGLVAEFRLKPRLMMRGEYEFQILPGFKGTPTATTSGCCGLTPNGFSVGFSYQVLR